MPPPAREPILHEGARVTLDVGGDTDMLSCRVVGLTGDELALLPLRPPGPPVWRRLAMRGQVLVLFEAGGQMRALRGAAAGVRPGGFLAVALTDDFRLGQKRRHSRAPLSLPVTLTEPADGDAWSSVSLDISAAGVRVRTPDVDQPARSGTITLTLPDGDAAAAGSLVQSRDDWVAYRLAPDDGTRARLAALVLTYHRQQLLGEPRA